MMEKRMTNGYDKFVYGRFYIPALAIFAFIFFVTGLDLAGVVIYAALFALALNLAQDEKYALAPLLMLIFQLSFRHEGKAVDYYSAPLAICFFAVAVIIAAAGIIRYAVKVRPLRTRRMGLKKRPMLLPFVVLAAVTLTGGLFYSPYNFASLLYAAGIALMFVAFYIVFCFLTHGGEDERVYLSKCMVAVMLLICAQLAAFYAFNFADYGVMDGKFKGSMVIGWGMSNTIGALLVMLIPAAYYLIGKNVMPVFNYISVFIAINAVYFTMSRAALLIGVPMCVVLSAITFFKKKPVRAKVGVMSAAFVALDLLLVLVIILAGKVQVFAGFFIENSVSDATDIVEASRGRIGLWIGYIKLFLSAPLFGTGFYNAFEKFMTSTMTIFSGMAHNTPLQYLGSCGIVGIAGYLYHRVESVRLFVKNYCYEKLMFAAGCAALVLMSLFDVFFMSPYFAMFYCLYIVLSEDCRPQPECEKPVSVYDHETATAARHSKKKDSRHV